MSTAAGPDSPYRFYYEQLGFKLVRAGRANLFKPDPSLPDSVVTTDLLVDELVVAGTPDQVADELHRLPGGDRRLRDAPLLRHRLGRPGAGAPLDGADGRRGDAPGQPRDRAGSRGGPGGRLTAFPRSATLAEV